MVCHKRFVCAHSGEGDTFVPPPPRGGVSRDPPVRALQGRLACSQSEHGRVVLLPPPAPPAVSRPPAVRSATVRRFAALHAAALAAPAEAAHERAPALRVIGAGQRAAAGAAFVSSPSTRRWRAGRSACCRPCRRRCASKPARPSGRAASCCVWLLLSPMRPLPPRSRPRACRPPERRLLARLCPSTHRPSHPPRLCGCSMVLLFFCGASPPRLRTRWRRRAVASRCCSVWWRRAHTCEI